MNFLPIKNAITMMIMEVIPPEILDNKSKLLVILKVWSEVAMDGVPAKL